MNHPTASSLADLENGSWALVARKPPEAKEWIWTLSPDDQEKLLELREAKKATTSQIALPGLGTVRTFALIARLNGKASTNSASTRSPDTQPDMPVDIEIVDEPGADQPSDVITAETGQQILPPALSQPLAVEIRKVSSDLRDLLFQELRDIRSGASNPQRAQAVSKVANCVIDSVRLQVETERFLRGADDLARIGRS